MKEAETIGRIEIGRIEHPSGRSYNILEMMSTEQGTFLIEGDRLKSFLSDILKAIQSGYALKDCTDDRLRSTWGRLVEQVREGVGKVTVTVSASANVSAEVETVTVNVPVVVIAENRETETDEVAEPENLEASFDVDGQPSPPEQKMLAVHLRDRRSPESPASEEIRLRIAASDRQTDALMAKFHVAEENGRAKDETIEIRGAPSSEAGGNEQMDAAAIMIAEFEMPETVETAETVKTEAAETEIVTTAEDASPFALF